MEWLTDLVGVGASAMTGGVFGIFGAVIGQVGKYFQEKQRQAWQEKKWSYEESMQRLQMEAHMQETEAELAIVAQEGSWSSLQASIGADSAMSASPWANNIRSLFRPLLTISLLVLAVWVFNAILASINSGSGIFAALFSDTEMRDILKYMIHSVFFTASTAALWWFAERAMTPPWAKK